MLFSANAFPKIGLYITIATLFYGLHLMGTFGGVVLIQLLGTIVFMTWIPRLRSLPCREHWRRRPGMWARAV